jgi:hypothetical protein
MKRLLHHLNSEQQRQLQAWLDRQTGKRTPSDEYIRENNKFAKIPTCKRPTARSVGNCDPGFEARHVKPHTDFNARRDLPPGWAIVSMYDSGGNHSIRNAAQAMHTELWNFWPCSDMPLKEQLHDERSPWGRRLRHELEHNNIAVK